MHVINYNKMHVINYSNMHVINYNKVLVINYIMASRGSLMRLSIGANQGRVEVAIQATMPSALNVMHSPM